MNRNQRILVALSRSEHDLPLLAYARQLAAFGIGRQFQFVHVQPAAPKHKQTDPALVQSELEKTVAQHFGDPEREVVRSCHVLSGLRVDALLDMAQRHRADLILLGHRRQRSGQRSLARRLAMIAPCSVWMVPEGAPCTIRRILAPVDFSEHSADSLAVAVSVARSMGVGEVTALHVAFDPSTVRYEEHVLEFRHDEEEHFQKFLAGIDAQGVRIVPRTQEGGVPARTILQSAKESQTDLIVMSTRGRSRAAAILLGSVATQVMMESPIAVLAVKHFGAALSLFEVLRGSHFFSGSNPKTN